MGLGSTKVIYCLTGANYLDAEHQSKTLSEFLKIIKLFVCNLVLLLPTYMLLYTTDKSHYVGKCTAWGRSAF